MFHTVTLFVGTLLVLELSESCIQMLTFLITCIVWQIGSDELI